MTRACSGPDLALDPLLQGVVKLVPGLADDKQQNPDVVVPILADDDRFLDLRKLLHLPVDLRRADPHTAGIERRVGAAVDDEAAMRGPFGKIAVMPDPLEAREIGALI